jgi:poly(A) polymerase
MIAVAEKLFKPHINPQTSLIINELASLLASLDIRSFVTGGFLRDVMLKKETADIDIALETDALKAAPKIAEGFNGKSVTLDEKDGIVRIILPDRKHYIDLVSALDGTTYDLKRRDFTINAMAINLSELSRGLKEGAAIPVIDPCNGVDDIKTKLIRVVDNNIFEKDPVRLLRAIRLAMELDFTLTTETELLMKDSAHLLSKIAGERLREELIKILAIPRSDRLPVYMEELGLITALFPELAKSRDVEQPKEHTWDVLYHSLNTVAAVDFVLREGDWSYTGPEVLDSIPWSEELESYFEQIISGLSTRRVLTKLAAILHDIAKPMTKARNSEGRIRFIGHPKEGELMASEALKKLRFSTREIKMVSAMVKNHLRPVQMSRSGEMPSERAIYRYFRDSEDTGIETLFLSLSDHLATRGPELESKDWQEHVKLVDYILKQKETQQKRVTPPKLVDGNDIMSVFGLKPGPRIQELLESIHEVQASGEITTRDEALTVIARLLKRTDD